MLVASAVGAIAQCGASGWPGWAAIRSVAPGVAVCAVRTAGGIAGRAATPVLRSSPRRTAVASRWTVVLRVLGPGLGPVGCCERVEQGVVLLVLARADDTLLDLLELALEPRLALG